MTRVLFVRHGRTTANASGVLAGRLPNIHLDRTGSAQATALGQALKPVPITDLVASPLPRTVETAKLIRAGLANPPKLVKDKAFIECDYGDWSGKKLKQLAKDPLWANVQAHPSGVTFPHGESMGAAQQRAVAATRTWAHAAHAAHGADAIVLVVSHGDVIKSIVADALGLHLDLFQRIVIDPGSVTAIDYHPQRPFVRLLNATADLAASIGTGSATSSDAAVGGGAGQRRGRK